MVIASDAMGLLVDCPDRPRVIAIGGSVLAKPGLMLSLVRVMLPAVALAASPKYSHSVLLNRIGLCIVDWLG